MSEVRILSRAVRGASDAGADRSRGQPATPSPATKRASRSDSRLASPAVRLHETLDVDATQAVRADRSRLQQLFENRYRNAAEHSSEDVTESVGTTDDGLDAADTGPGVPESAREETFEAGHSTAEAGTGFGLRTVEQTADAHGWEVGVTESERGGARFESTGVEFADR